MQNCETCDLSIPSCPVPFPAIPTIPPASSNESAPFPLFLSPSSILLTCPPACSFYSSPDPPLLLPAPTLLVPLPPPSPTSPLLQKLTCVSPPFSPQKLALSIFVPPTPTMCPAKKDHTTNVVVLRFSRFFALVHCIQIVFYGMLSLAGSGR